MIIQEVGLRGANQPVQLPSHEVGSNGIILKRPLGSGAMFIGSSSVEVNYPLTEDRELRLHCNPSQLWATGLDGETLHLIVDKA